MSAMKSSFSRFLLGFGLIVVAALAASPRLWSGPQLIEAFTHSAERRDVVVVRALMPTLLRDLRREPERLAELGRRYIKPLDEPELMRGYAERLLRLAPADDPAAAEAHLMLARAAELKQDRETARKEYELVAQRFWDCQQAVDAQNALGFLLTNSALREIEEAAKRSDWTTVLAFFSQTPYTSFGPSDLVGAASLFLTALLATDRNNDAVSVLLAVAAPGSGINLPEVIAPWRMAKYPSAVVVLQRVLEKLPANHRWRIEVHCVLALLQGDWETLIGLLPKVDHNIALQTAMIAWDRRVEPAVGYRIFTALAPRTDWPEEDVAMLYSVAASYEVGQQDAARAKLILREGLGRIPRRLAGSMLVLQVHLDYADKPDEALAQIVELLKEFHSNGQVAEELLREGRDLLRRNRRDAEACAFVRQHADVAGKPEVLQRLLQGCPLP